MRTATIQRSPDALNFSMRSEAVASSESTTVGAARERVQDLRVRARHGLIGREHEAAGIGTWWRISVRRRSAAESTAGIALRVERRAPRLRGDVLGVVLAEVRLELVAGARAPAHLARVHVEQHGAHHAVLQRPPVAVRVVRAGDPGTRFVGQVLDERDRRGVAAERSSRQQQTRVADP
jgi:hypothetical protein